MFGLTMASKLLRSACPFLTLLSLFPVLAFAANPQQQSGPAQATPPAQAGRAAQGNPSNQSSAPAQAGAAAPAGVSGQKVIQDEAEYNAYKAAVNTQDPKERAEALESFVQRYPKSVAASDALEQAMSAWQSAGDAVKVLEVAKELLAADSGNVRALAIVVALDRVSAAQGDTPALDELCLYSTAGMREISMWQKPAEMTDADFASLNKQMARIFNSAAGYCALEQRNFFQARDWFTRSIETDPSNLQDVYELAIADLELTPIDANGFWYCARAIQLAKSSPNASAAGGMEDYCKPKYETYHGSLAGWDAILSASAAQNALPPGFAKGISPAPPATPPSQQK